MQNPRLATRYAKSLLDIAVEKNSLDAALSDMQLLNEIFIHSHDFTVMLRSPVIHGSKKVHIIGEVLKGKGVNELTMAFIKLMASKGREATLPEVATAFIDQYNELKGIKTVKLTTAVPIAEDLKNSIRTKVSGYMPKNSVELETSVNEDLIGGFVLEVGDKLFDASIRRSLNEMRTKLTDSSYVSRI